MCSVYFARCVKCAHCAVCSALKVLRGAPYKQPPSRPLSPLHEDNNDGNYVHMMDTVISNSGKEFLNIVAHWWALIVKVTETFLLCNQTTINNNVPFHSNHIVGAV